jgi:hypothetical protein
MWIKYETFTAGPEEERPPGDMHEPPPYPASKLDWSSIPGEEDDE